MERDLYDLLSEIGRNLDRIASALETYNNAAIRVDEPLTHDGHVEIFATVHES